MTQAVTPPVVSSPGFQHVLSTGARGLMTGVIRGPLPPRESIGGGDEYGGVSDWVLRWVGQERGCPGELTSTGRLEMEVVPAASGGGPPAQCGEREPGSGEGSRSQKGGGRGSGE